MKLLIGVLTAWAVATVSDGGECIDQVFMETYGSSNGFRINFSDGDLDGGDHVIMVRKAGDWKVAKKDGDSWVYVDEEEYNVGVVEEYEITVGDKNHRPLCGKQSYEMLRSDMISNNCVEVTISQLVTEAGPVEGFKTSETTADVIVEVDGGAPDGHVLEVTVDGTKWSTIQQVDDKYSYTLTTKDNKTKKFPFKARLRRQDVSCPSVSQEVVLDPYVPEFDVDTVVKVDSGEVDIIDINTSRKDEDIKYEIVGARSKCDEWWALQRHYKDWQIHIFEFAYGYVLAAEDFTTRDDVPYMQRDVTGLAGLTQLEVDMGIRAQDYRYHVEGGTWAVLHLYFDGVKYITWENFKEDVPMVAHMYNNAVITPTETPVEPGDVLTTFRVTIPWNGNDKATIRYEYEAGRDNFWISDVRPVNDTALGNCEDDDDTKALFEIDEKSGKLKFKSAPDSEEYYRVKVKATTDVGLESDVTIRVGVN